MQKLCLTLFLLLSQCSIYDLSQNLRLEEILTAPGIKLVSPSIDSTIFADSLNIDVTFQNVAQGIKELNIIGLTFSSNITFSSQTKKHSFKMSIPLTNNELYSSSKGEYPITLKLIGGDNSTIESNYIIPIKIKSIHTNSTSLIFPVRPIDQNEWDNSSIKITPLETGAKIRSIKATITGSTSISYTTNISSENDYNLVNIPLKNIKRGFINTSTPLSMSLEITSENQGIITKSIEYGLATTIIALVKPSTTTPTITDTIDLKIEFTNLVNKIKSVKLISPSITNTITPPDSPQKTFTYTRSIPLSNSTDYNTTKGQYKIAVTMTDRTDNSITSNYIIPVKIKSVHTNNESIRYPARPINQGEWNKATITVNPLESGAGINYIAIQIFIADTAPLFNTNITTENSYKSVNINFTDLLPKFIEGSFRLETTILSVNDSPIYNNKSYPSVADTP